MAHDVGVKAGNGEQEKRRKQKHPEPAEGNGAEAAQRAMRRRYQGMALEAIAMKAIRWPRNFSHDLRGEARHFVVLRRALQEHERAAAVSVVFTGQNVGLSDS